MVLVHLALLPDSKTSLVLAANVATGAATALLIVRLVRLLGGVWPPSGNRAGQLLVVAKS